MTYPINLISSFGNRKYKQRRDSSHSVKVSKSINCVYRIALRYRQLLLHVCHVWSFKSGVLIVSNQFVDWVRRCRGLVCSRSRVLFRSIRTDTRNNSGECTELDKHTIFTEVTPCPQFHVTKCTKLNTCVNCNNKMSWPTKIQRVY